MPGESQAAAEGTRHRIIATFTVSLMETQATSEEQRRDCTCHHSRAHYLPLRPELEARPTAHLASHSAAVAQDAPQTAPASTSEGQWTPTCTRLHATPAATPSATSPAPRMVDHVTNAMAKKLAAWRLGSEPTSLAGASQRNVPGGSAKHGRILPMRGRSTCAPRVSLKTRARPNASRSSRRRGPPASRMVPSTVVPTTTPNHLAERITEKASRRAPPSEFSAWNSASSMPVWWSIVIGAASQHDRSHRER